MPGYVYLRLSHSLGGETPQPHVGVSAILHIAAGSLAEAVKLGVETLFMSLNEGAQSKVQLANPPSVLLHIICGCTISAG